MKTKALACLGYLTIAAAAISARLFPATKYELSIYTETPAISLASVVGALLIGIWIALHERAIYRGMGLSIACGGVLVTSLLGIIRGYYFIGAGDSLTHLGHIRDTLSSGELATTFYPGTHFFAVAIHEVIGQSLLWSSMIVPILYLTCFLLFTGLIGRELVSAIPTDSPIPAATIAGGVALLVLPINHIGTYLMLHPTSHAVLFFPVFLYSVVRYLRPNPDNRLIGVFIPISLGLLAIHPQHAMLGFIILAGVAGVIRLASLVAGEAKYTPGIEILVVILGVGVFRWVADSERFEIAVAGFARLLLTLGENSESAVDSTGSSLSASGITPFQLFIRLFGVSVIIATLAAIPVLVYALQSRKKNFHWGKQRLLYLGFGAIPLAVLTLVMIAFQPNTVSFRFVGIMMVLASVFGVGGIQLLTSKASNYISDRSVRISFGVGMSVLLLASLVILQPSPLILKDSFHVSESTHDGAEMSLEHWPDDAQYLEHRTPMYRFAEGIYGVDGAITRNYSISSSPSLSRRPAPDHYSGTLAANLSEPHFVIVTERDRELSELYNGFRYGEDEYRYLSSNGSLVLDSGGLEVYRIDSDNEQ